MLGGAKRASIDIRYIWSAIDSVERVKLLLGDGKVTYLGWGSRSPPSLCVAWPSECRVGGRIELACRCLFEQEGRFEKQL
jgi:hypothetical protein